jgi:peptide/nickel transport system substrate-binding protein
VSSLQQSGDVAGVGFTRAIAVDGAGIWLLRGDRTLWRLDAASGAPAGSTRLGAGEWSAMATGSGAVFVADADAGVIEQIREADGHVRRIALGNASGGLAFAGGYLWSTIVPSVAGIAGADAAGSRGGTLRVVAQSDPGAWDGSVWDTGAFGIESATCDGLLDYGRYTNGTEAPPLVPAIAAGMPAVSADGRAYTFRIRSRLHFSNGRLVTAADVKASYLRALDPKAGTDTTSAARVYFNVLDGYDAYEKGAHDISGIAVRGDEVSFHLTRAYGAFPYLTAHRSMCIVPSGSSHFPTIVPPPMTGPYRLGSYVRGRAAVFTRNPYWRQNAAALGIDARSVATVDRIVVQFGVSPDDQVRMIERGQADVTMYGDVFASSAAFRAARARLEQGHQLYTTPDDGLVYLWMRTDLAPFRSRALRQAVSYAIDRTRIAPLIPGRNDHPWSALLPSTLTAPGARQIYPLVADPARARALVRSTGLTLPIVVALPYVGDHRFQFTPSMRELAADLDRVGFRVHLEPRDVFAYFNALPNPKSRIQMGMQTWSADVPDPVSYLEPLFLAGAGVNNGRFDEPAVNRALLAAAALPLSAARRRAYAAVEATLEREAPAAMLGEADQTFLLSKRLHGFAWNEVIGTDYARISLAGS